MVRVGGFHKNERDAKSKLMGIGKQRNEKKLGDKSNWDWYEENLHKGQTQRS